MEDFNVNSEFKERADKLSRRGTEIFEKTRDKVTGYNIKEKASETVGYYKGRLWGWM